jgi:hypothetical protein
LGLSKRSLFMRTLAWFVAGCLGYPGLAIAAQELPEESPKEKADKLVKDIKAGLDEYVKLSKAAKAVLDGQRPSADSEEGQKFVRLLQADKAVLEQLAPDTFRTSIAPMGSIPTSLEPARAYIEGHADNFQRAADEYSEVRDSYVNKLDDIDDALSRLSEVAQKVTEILEQILGLPLPEEAMALKYGHVWLDMVVSAQPLLGDCEATAASKRREADSIFKDRAQAIRGQATQLLGALAAEQAVLQGEASRLQQLVDQLKAAEDAFNLEERGIADLGVTVEARRRDIESLERDFDEETRERDQIWRDIESAKNNEKSLRAWLSTWKSNWRCPKGLTWDKCKEHQSQKDAYLRDVVGGKQRDLDATLVREKELAARGDKIEYEANDTHNTLWNYRSRLSDEQKIFDQRTAAHSTARASLEKQRTATMKEAYPSRANILASASRADTGAIQATLGQLQ